MRLPFLSILGASFLLVSFNAMFVCGADAPAASKPTPDQVKFFESQVRPLLAGSCINCHGDSKQKGRLRLDSLKAALKGGNTGPAIVPGTPEKSLLIEAVSYKNEDLQMPPKEQLLPAQVEVLTSWIKMGAPWPEGAAVTVAAKSKIRKISDEDRKFWSFQPVKDSPVPSVQDNGWARNPIDKFVFARLATEGLAPAQEADRVTLVRRAYFDLHGLPPTPAEIDAFVNDPSPDAYEKVIDRLLASPRYGERYGRHWFDIVRYAESDGFRQDAYRPNAWHYRDYVIRSFNADKPYNRFVTEQLAGDEAFPGDTDALVATGFLRHGMYEYNQRDAESHWDQLLNDVTDVTADAFLGLSMGCARCHDHKFDPILQADYFQLRSFFSAVLPRNDLPYGTKSELEKYHAATANWEAKTKSIRDEIAQVEAQARKNAYVRVTERFPSEVLAMMQKPEAERTPYEKQISYLVMRQVDEDLVKLDDKIKGKDRDKLLELRRKLAEFDSLKPVPLPAALCATDVGPIAPETRIPKDSQKRTFDPGYPTVLRHLPLKTPEITPSAGSTGRRAALAQWLTQPENPLSTRVIANRLWQWHFGRGIVGTASDYGTLGDKPTHPELLDWLTTRFVQNGWTMKQMHRLIMTSATYRQAAIRPIPEVAKLKDPENHWLWRMNPRRLEAEQIRDSILAASGELKLDRDGGPSLDYTSPVRTVYTKQVRNTRDPLLEVFDVPESFGSVPNRNVTTTATQSLLMINGDWVLKRAAAFAQRVAKESPSQDPAARARTAWKLAYGRMPTSDEEAGAVAFLSRKMGTIASSTPAPVAPAAEATAAKPSKAAGPMDVMDMPVTQIMPAAGGNAILVRNADPADILKVPQAADAPMFKEEFTIEAYVLLESLYENASVRVIASQWNGDKKNAGWSFGVTSEKSAYQPRNLIMQFVGTPAGDGAYEVIPSNFRLELHKTYYVAAVVRLSDTSEAGVTFYIKDVGDMDAPLRSVGVKHHVTTSVIGTSPLILGGREGAPAMGWDGLIGEVRLSRAALKPEQLLYHEGGIKDAIVGHWTFEENPGLMKDRSGLCRDLVKLAAGRLPKGKTSAGSTAVASPAAGVKVDAALVDLCHTLLNSSEFLYAD